MTEFTTERGLPLSDPAFVRGWSECRRALSGTQLRSDPAAGGHAVKPTYNLLLLDDELHEAGRRLVTRYLTRPGWTRSRRGWRRPPRPWSVRCRAGPMWT